jgi:HEPN domain-containing protein
MKNFNGEKMYSKEEAKEAFEGAKEILKFIKNLKIKLMKGEKLK